MEYQKIANFLASTLNQPSNESKESYKPGSDIKFKTTMLRFNLCDYDDMHTYLLRKR